MRTSIIVLVLLAAPVAAHAQVAFPADSEYRPLRCGNAVSTDAVGDDADFLQGADIVGTPASPAVLRASDATNLYLRIRLEDNPAMPNGNLTPFSWGIAFDLDDDLSDYELLLLVDGVTDPVGAVTVLRNTATTVPNSPTDPADLPAAQTYAFAMNARAVAAGTQLGADDDYFLDFAVPWSALIPLGLERDTPTRVWVASSDSANSLNGDFACHMGGGAAPTLPGAASDPTTGDPNDPGANGGEGRLEGGGGCATSGGMVSPLFALLALVLARRRRR